MAKMTTDAIATTLRSATLTTQEKLAAKQALAHERQTGRIRNAAWFVLFLCWLRLSREYGQAVERPEREILVPQFGAGKEHTRENIEAAVPEKIAILTRAQFGAMVYPGAIDSDAKANELKRVPEYTVVSNALSYWEQSLAATLTAARAAERKRKRAARVAVLEIGRAHV